MNKFRNWYLTYYNEITWFMIGWLAMAGLDALVTERYFSALFDFGLSYINYTMWTHQ